MKLAASVGIAGTSLSLADESTIAGRWRTGASRTRARYIAMFADAACGGAVAGDERANPTFRAAVIDLPVSKQLWVPLCPRERST